MIWKTSRAPRRRLAGAAGTVLALILSTAVPSAGSPTGTLTAVRTVGKAGHAGLYGWGAATMKDGSVLISDYWNFRVQHYNVDGTLRRTAVKRDNRHLSPYDVAVDLRDDSIYIGDVDQGRDVDKYDKFGRYLYSLGGPETFQYPAWLDVDAAGRVAVADSRAHRIVVFDSQGQEMFRFGSQGSAPSQFHTPRGMAFDGSGRLFVADTNNDRMQVFAISDTGATFLYEWTVSGDFRGLTVDKARGIVYLVNAGAAGVQRFSLTGSLLGVWQGIHGRGVTVDGKGNVWVGDMPNFRARRWSPAGMVLPDVPRPAAPPVPGGFAQPGSAALDSAGNILVTDTFNFRVQKLTNAGAFVSQFGGRGGGDVDEFALNYARGIAVDRRDDAVIVGNTDGNDLRRYDRDGRFLWMVENLKVYAVDAAADGRIFAADSNAGLVRVFTPDGQPAGTFGAGKLVRPRGIAVDADGSVWVSSHGNGTVRHFSAGGALLGTFGGTAEGVLEAWDVEVDGTHVFLADLLAHNIKVWAKNGQYVGAFASHGRNLGQIIAPQGLDIGPDGMLYVTEKSGERISVFRID